MAKPIQGVLDYDPATGVFVWAKGTRLSGKMAGCKNKLGYRVIRVFGKLELAHRLAWLIIHGEFPTDELDHINGDRADNRIANLRPATHAENSRNRRRHIDNTSGFKGVFAHQGRWRARIRCGDVVKSLGVYADKSAAHAAYCSAAVTLHGEFARPE